MRKQFLLAAIPVWFLLFFGLLVVHGASPTFYTPVPLVVSIHPADSGWNPCAICGDTLGIYSDGVDGVAASFDKYGNLIINFQTGRTALRKVYFDYSRPVDANNMFRPPTDQPYPYLSTVPGPGNVAIQAMPVGATQCVQLAWTFTVTDAKQTQYRNNFQRKLSAFDTSVTSYAVVTHLGGLANTGQDTWEVEPKAATCNTGTPTIAKLFSTPTVGKFVFTDQGLFYMPFKLTLTAR